MAQILHYSGVPRIISGAPTKLNLIRISGQLVSFSAVGIIFVLYVKHDGEKNNMSLTSIRFIAAVTVVLVVPLFTAAEEPCEGGGYNPTPVAVAVTSVPIVVTSTTDDYFVLYVKHDVDGTEVEYPVLVKLGETGTTTLSENVEALPAARYRVEKYQVTDPADVDGDCIDDITELNDPANKNPVNPAAAIALTNGAVIIPDHQTFEALSSTFDGSLDPQVKFLLLDIDTASPSIYFINTKTHIAHVDFLNALNLESHRVKSGSISYNQNLVAPAGSKGVFYISINLGPFSLIEREHTLVAASVPLIDGSLGMHIPNRMIWFIRDEMSLFRASRINLLFDKDIYGETDFLALNQAEGYGLLRVREADERPHSREVVIYEALPNELPRVAGIISTVPQTPLSHINLRAIQDGIPNAFIRDALDETSISSLVGSYVRYSVGAYNYSIRAATLAEVNAHYESSRPAQTQTPQRDLSIKTIKPLSQIGFNDWKAFGVKAANVAVLRTLGFPTGTVPDGFAIPFYFYNTFMQDTALGQETVLGKGSGPDEEKITLTAEKKLHEAVTAMLAHSKFQTDFDIQDEMLDDLRDAIKDAESPQWIKDALTAMHATFPAGQSLRYRSSTNNEDLPGFNGAGLYDSYTQHPDETEEDGIDKSMKQVFASLWTFRAFTEREFHRIDHMAAAMGVLVHPNYEDELANGVAVSFDPITGMDGSYYVNTQLGEDLTTNPDAYSVPEELLLRRSGQYRVLATSNLVEPGELLMSDDQLRQLGQHLGVIHDHFAGLYNLSPYAIEIEFKITSTNILAIKQARPWVFSGTSRPVRPPPVRPLPVRPPPVRPHRHHHHRHHHRHHHHRHHHRHHHHRHHHRHHHHRHHHRHHRHHHRHHRHHHRHHHLTRPR